MLVASPTSIATAGSTLSATTQGSERAIALWLLAVCTLVLAMVVVGGMTRLTHSGLSITEWQPIVGTIPPLSADDWNSAFAKYRATPEYREVNQGMTLPEFQRIFWWEYVHRLLGRLIGAAFLVPFLWFLARRRIPLGYGAKLAGIFVLGGLQGALGWYMVKSGLVDDPRVSHLRLTAHLGLAFLIFAGMFWTALSLLFPRNLSRRHNAARATGLSSFALTVAALVFLQVLTGGLVAGMRAGFAYNTFPLMNGHLVPPEILLLEPWWRNVFNNMATVQFNHRLLALVLALAIPALWWKIRGSASPDKRVRWAVNLLLAMLVLQVSLGVLTLLYVVPLPLAAAHQACALLLFASALNLAHALRK